MYSKYQQGYKQLQPKPKTHYLLTIALSIGIITTLNLIGQVIAYLNYLPTQLIK